MARCPSRCCCSTTRCCTWPDGRPRPAARAPRRPPKTPPSNPPPTSLEAAMHPEISRRHGEQHRAELHRQAERRRLAARPHRPRPARLAVFWAAVPFVARRMPALWRRRGHGGGAPLGVFMAGPDAFGFRTYLTADEARQLAADWAAM